MCEVSSLYDKWKSIENLFSWIDRQTSSETHARLHYVYVAQCSAIEHVFPMMTDRQPWWNQYTPPTNSMAGGTIRVFREHVCSLQNITRKSDLLMSMWLWDRQTEAKVIQMCCYASKVTHKLRLYKLPDCTRRTDGKPEGIENVHWKYKFTI